MKYINGLRKDLKIFSSNKDHNGKSTWVIYDSVVDRYYRISENTYNVLLLLNDPITYEKLKKNIQLMYSYICDDELLKIITFLSNNNLLQCSYKVTETKINKTKEYLNKMLFVKLLSSYLFFRIPLCNPDNFLTKTFKYVKLFFNKWIILVLALFSLVGYFGIVMHWNKFTSAMISSLNYSGLIKYGLTIIILKIFHELGHAYAAKYCGIRVRKFGIGFIIFFPRLFTDITDSWRLKKTYQKILIDVSGILIEVLIGGMAALVWLNTESGAVHTITYYIFTVTIISTILINGNPFIRYDGYYLLMDMMNIDNLQYQSITLNKELSRKYLFGLKEKTKIDIIGWKRYFLTVFGVCSFIYRLFLYTGIILIVYFKFTKAVGIILMIMEIYVLVLNPIIKELRYVMNKKIFNKNTLITSIIVIILLLVIFLPLPWTIKLPCIVDSSDSQIIYIKESGYLNKFSVDNYSIVEKGQSLFKLINPTLDHDIKKQKTYVNIFELELDQQKIHTNVSLDMKIQQLLNMQNILKENLLKHDELNVLAPLTGIFILFDWNLQTGKWLKKGMPIGEVFSEKKIIINSYVSEKNIVDVELNSKVKIYLHETITPFYGTVTHINKVPFKKWKPSPLLNRYGGPLEVLKQNKYNYILKDYFYEITITPNKHYSELQYSRTGYVKLKQYSSIGLNVIRTIMNAIYKELTF